MEKGPLGRDYRGLRARVEQNLGILANIQGDQLQALAHYERSLEEYRAAGDEHGCAIAYHNLGMVNADRKRFDAASCYFQESYTIAERTGDAYLQGLCLVNHGEVDVARQRYDDARQRAEAAQTIFDRLGSRGHKASALRVLGMAYRETGRTALAESLLKGAIELAAATGRVLNEAEASRELALLYKALGRNHEALRQLNTAHCQFQRLNARIDLVDVDRKIAELKATYVALVRAWSQSLELSDSGAFGRSERVARHAVALARALGLDAEQEMTILLGAYLHDLGLMRVPRHFRNKTEALTPDEFDVFQMHPIWGLELLGTAEFPWDVKPIIRWHHEHYDGSGYPDRLKGDEIPVPAQIVGIVDVYVALTASRADAPALSTGQALEQMRGAGTWWPDRVFHAFVRVATRTA